MKELTWRPGKIMFTLKGGSGPMGPTEPWNEFIEFLQVCYTSFVCKLLWKNSKTYPVDLLHLNFFQ